MNASERIDEIDKSIKLLKEQITTLENDKLKIYTECIHDYVRVEVYDPYDDLYVCRVCGHFIWK